MNRMTMSDIAKKAGVSLMTVSRVINGKGDVSPETRKRVQQIIAECEYRPSSIARGLATRRTFSIGLIVPDISNPYFSGMAQGVSEVAYKEDFSVLLCNCDEHPERELEMLQVLDEKRVEGIILAAPRTDTHLLAQSLAAHLNVVVINRQFDEKDNPDIIGGVINNDETGGRKVTKMLLEHGHKTVGLLAGPPLSYGAARRLNGYKAALAEAGISFDPEIVKNCAPTVKGGHDIASQLLSRRKNITSIFCYNDLVAIGALQACADLGLKVPGDIAIVGFDDIPMASWVSPQLTTLHVEFEELGRLATQLLIACIKGNADGPSDIVLEPEVIIRASAP